MRHKIFLILAIASLGLPSTGTILASAQTETEHAHGHHDHSDHDHEAHGHDGHGHAHQHDDHLETDTATDPPQSQPGEHDHTEPAHDHAHREEPSGQSPQSHDHDRHESGAEADGHNHGIEGDTILVPTPIPEDEQWEGQLPHDHAHEAAEHDEQGHHGRPSSESRWNWSAPQGISQSDCTWTRERLRSRITLVREERMALLAGWQSYRSWILEWSEQMEYAGAQTGATREAFRNADRTATQVLNALSQREQALQTLGKWACTPGDVLQAARVGSRETLNTLHQAKKNHVQAVNNLALTMMAGDALGTKQ